MTQSTLLPSRDSPYTRFGVGSSKNACEFLKEEEKRHSPWFLEHIHLFNSTYVIKDWKIQYRIN